MATIRINPIARGLSGSLGNLVFRQLRGRTILASKPNKIRKQSEQQRENRSRFKLATYWAKGQMLDPEKKAYYWRMAKKLKLPNAYTAAVSDYMRKSEIKEIDTRQYKRKAGDMIRLKVGKKDFAVHKVEVTILSADGNFVESGMAVKRENDVFIYKAKMSSPDIGPVTIKVALCDNAAYSVKREVVLLQ